MQCPLCFEFSKRNRIEVVDDINVFVCTSGCGRFNWDYATQRGPDDPIAQYSCPQRRRIEREAELDFGIAEGPFETDVVEDTYRETLRKHLLTCKVCEDECMEDIDACT